MAGVMAWTQEASSLSSVTEIASDPPPRPDAPIASRQALVLYIARVPGSRDVFLTPIKPREKVVTAEDVQSSLYFVHIACEDEGLDAERSGPGSIEDRASQSKSDQDRSARKEVPARRANSSPSYPIDDRQPVQPKKPWQRRIARKPVLSNSETDEAPPVPVHVDLPGIPRRPMPTPNGELRRPSLHDENVRLLRRAEHSDETNPYLRTYGAEPHYQANYDAPAVGTLTLIRRDPVSGEQWNVGSISDPPVQEVSCFTIKNPSSTSKVKRAGAPLYLDITNPSYARFIDRSRPEYRTSSSNSENGEPAPDGVFRRRLYMPGSRHGEHRYGQMSTQSVDSTNSSSLEIPRSLRDLSSVDLLSYQGAPSFDRRVRSYYSFASPWNGTCSFATGATGKSLKCRHNYSNASVEVSELRFNLPTSTRHTPTPLAQTRSSYFSRHTRHLSHDEALSPGLGVVINEDGQVDLELGQERAGGGFGGKQAKLGKLIIEPEGLKMLDLLVAANIGLWWRAYERA